MATPLVDLVEFERSQLERILAAYILVYGRDVVDYLKAERWAPRVNLFALEIWKITRENPDDDLQVAICERHLFGEYVDALNLADAWIDTDFRARGPLVVAAYVLMQLTTCNKLRMHIKSFCDQVAGHRFADPFYPEFEGRP